MLWKKVRISVDKTVLKDGVIGLSFFIREEVGQMFTLWRLIR